MRLRHASDRKTILWALVLMPGVAIAQYAWPMLAPWMMPLSIYLAYCAAAIAHNHNHSPTFVSRRLNHAFATWISFFYGYPIFAWIPTHNENHHKFVNRPGDATITSLVSPHNTLWNAVTYFFASQKSQAPLVKAFLQRTRTKSPRLYRMYIAQYVAVFGGHATALAVALALHGAKRGLIVYASALLVPALLSLWGIMFTNYVQHVECDAWSEWNHSRNFVSPLWNWFIFDNGFHTVHHEQPGLHWSRLRAAHEQIADRIDPRLQESSILAYCVRRYLVDAIRQWPAEPPASWSNGGGAP